MTEGETQRIELISGIDDIWTMNKLLEALEIPSKGCQTLQDMKNLVINITDQSSKSNSWSAGQVRMVALKRRHGQTVLFFICVLLIALLGISEACCESLFVSQGIVQVVCVKTPHKSSLNVIKLRNFRFIC